MGSTHSTDRDGVTPVSVTPTEESTSVPPIQAPVSPNNDNQSAAALHDQLISGSSPESSPATSGAGTDLEASLQTATPLLSADIPLSNGERSETAVFPTGDPSELAYFGQRGRLRPAPRCVSRQPADVWAQVPDTTIEWSDFQGLSIRGLSIRGHIHRYEGSVRQDQLAVTELDELIVCAVADGLGSKPDSYLGAALASRSAASRTLIDKLIASNDDLLDCTEIGEKLKSEALRRGLDPGGVSTTLTFAVFASNPTRHPDGRQYWPVTIAHIGDSHAYRLNSGNWEFLTRRGTAISDSLSNVVEPLPHHTTARVIRFHAMPGDVIALTTDGIGNLLEDQRDFANELAMIWRDSAPSPAHLLYVLDASVKSYDDDRTFLAVRFGAAP